MHVVVVRCPRGLRWLLRAAFSVDFFPCLLREAIFFALPHIMLQNITGKGKQYGTEGVQRHHSRIWRPLGNAAGITC